MRVSRTSLVASFALLTCSLAACDDKATSDSASATASAMKSGSSSSGAMKSGSSSSASGGMATTSAVPSAAPSASAAAAPAPLSDDQIAQVVINVNQGEIDQGNLAVKQATDPDTKKLADTMITEHKQWLKDGGDLFKKEKISPAKSSLADDLERDSKALVTRISNLKGAEFDQAYVEAQVKNHQDALDLIDKNLLVQVKDAAFKDMLTTVRGKVQGHLEHCKKVLAALGAAPGTAKGAAAASAIAPKK